jgi:hypothetical protein
MKLGSLGTLLLGLYLIAQGLISLIGLHFQGLPVLMGVLALAAGALLLARR